jgi:hypothetical protein
VTALAQAAHLAAQTASCPAPEAGGARARGGDPVVVALALAPVCYNCNLDLCPSDSGLCQGGDCPCEGCEAECQGGDGEDGAECAPCAHLAGALASPVSSSRPSPPVLCSTSASALPTRPVLASSVGLGGVGGGEGGEGFSEALPSPLPQQLDPVVVALVLVSAVDEKCCALPSSTRRAPSWKLAVAVRPQTCALAFVGVLCALVIPPSPPQQEVKLLTRVLTLVVLAWLATTFWLCVSRLCPRAAAQSTGSGRTPRK